MIISVCYLVKGLAGLCGWVDLLIETKEGHVIVERKASRLVNPDWLVGAVIYFRQLGAYWYGERVHKP